MPPVTNTPQDPRPVTFAANDEYLVSGGSKGVNVHLWRRVEDSQPLIATMQADGVRCVACSKNGRIAAGTFRGYILVWDAKNYRQTSMTWNVQDVTRGLNFSPDGTRLIVLGDQTVAIWNLTTRGVDIPSRCPDRVWAAKYSPSGNLIAAATEESVRVYNSNDMNNRLQDIKPGITTYQYNTALVWSQRHVFILSGDSIKKIDASTGSLESEWTVPGSDQWSCIAVPSCEGFVACSANESVTFWDPLIHNKLGDLPHSQNIYSITLSPDGRFLAIGGEKESITIKRLSRIIEPGFGIQDAAIDLWKHGDLREANEELSAATPASHHVLASQACIWARLGEFDKAIQCAEEANQLQPTVIGYIAKSMAMLGKGEKNKAFRACDIAFQRCDATNISFLLLIKAVIVSMAGEHDDAISRVNDLILTLHFHTECYMVQAYMYFLLGESHLRSGRPDEALQVLDIARSRLQCHTSKVLSVVSMLSGWEFDGLEIAIQQCQCEALYAAGNLKQAGKFSLEIVDSHREVDEMPESIANWACGFFEKYLSTPETTAPDLPFLTLFLTEWSKLKLKKCPWRDALKSAISFRASRSTIYRVVCKQLESLQKTMDATECFHEMMDKGVNTHDERAWILEFKQDLGRKLEQLGDAALHAQNYDEAISGFSAVLSLGLGAPPDILVKRSKAYISLQELREQARSTPGALPQLNNALDPHDSSLCEKALNDANAAIEVDPSSPWGYERKHAALHAAGKYKDAIDAFETMCLKISQSPDQRVRERIQEYVDPDDTKKAIRKVVHKVVKSSPRILINTFSGRLLNEAKQELLFESLPLYLQLISSMTTRIDKDHIRKKVLQYYRYAMFSHTWEDNEPLHDKVVDAVVYELEESFTNNKLREFCKIARDAGLHWAWSDTCCINKADHLMLQEALVAMFKWYEGSAVTIVFLRGVCSPSQRGDLVKSLWNTRGWTFQEYHASKVVRFYTEDWVPYLNLNHFNHKECQEILSEMEEVTRVPNLKEALMDLRPGLLHIREKLCLASGRKTTYVEDAAYSLLGIFGLSMPIVYGEKDHALGRLLSQLLDSSGDTSILAWTGKSGSFNSCLPAGISAFRDMPKSHIPEPILDDLMAGIMLRSPPALFTQADLSLASKLYDRLQELPAPSFAAQRMRISCLKFKLGPLSGSQDGSKYIFRAKAGALGVVELKTKEKLSQYPSLILIHPWIDYLLHRHPVGTGTVHETASLQSFETRNSSSSLGSFNSTRHGGDRTSWIEHLWPTRSQSRGNGSLISPASTSHAEKQAKTIQLLVRLSQPFGALLLTQTRHNAEEYRRVASESLITVQVKTLTSTVLSKLIESARTLDVL